MKNLLQRRFLTRWVSRIFPSNTTPPGMAFSLIEMLVAMAILALVLTLLFQLTSIIGHTTQSAQGRMERMAGLRGALDRISADFASGVFRDDLPPLLEKINGNDALYFYAEVPGYDGDRGISRLGYRIQTNGLVRGAEGTGWTNNTVGFSKSQADPDSLANSSFVTDPANPNYDLIADHVFRLELEFLMKDGSIERNDSIRSWAEVQSVIVTLVATDERALKISPGTLAELAGLFPDQTDNIPVAKAWTALLDDPGFYTSATNFPAKSLQSLEIRQRIYPLH